MFRKLTAVSLAALMMLGTCTAAYAENTNEVPAATETEGFKLSFPSQEEIINKAKELGIDLSMADTMKKAYSLASPNYVPGEVSDASSGNALKLLNFYRYVAGLPGDIKLKADYSELAQACALVNAANQSLSHTPEKPQGMSSALYEKACAGAAGSNIAMGNGNLAKSIQGGWMNDSNEKNIYKLGHRRWLLNPSMQYTGFGSAEEYTAMYSFDRTRAERFTGDYVAWPAPNTPIEMFEGQTFSFSLNTEFDEPDIDKVTVEVTSEKSGRTWELDKTYDDPYSTPYFNVNNQGYGLNKCIIFKLDETFSEGDVVNVKINGLSKNKESILLEYTTKFFSLSKIEIDTDEVILGVNEVVPVGVSTSSLIDKGKDVVWTSNNYEVAWMSENGVYGYDTGEAVLTATASSGLSAKLHVTVTNDFIEVRRIDINETEVTLTVGETFTIIPKVYPPNAHNSTFKVEIKGSAIQAGNYSMDGLEVKAVKRGKATVTFTTPNMVSASCTINVINEGETLYELGDVNKDGRVSIDDATAIQRFLAGSLQLGNEDRARADVNRDGRVSIDDATHIQKYLAHCFDQF